MNRHSGLRTNRREWTKAFAAAMGAVPAIAQVTSKVPPQGAPVPAKPSATPEQKSQKAASDVHKVSDRLAQIEVPMDVEPAFAFHA